MWHLDWRWGVGLANHTKGRRITVLHGRTGRESGLGLIHDTRVVPWGKPTGKCFGKTEAVALAMFTSKDTMNDAWSESNNSLSSLSLYLFVSPR
jgi:hypothetical protein